MQYKSPNAIIFTFHVHICFYFTVQTNTFQGILITNGTGSYTVFTYECGAIGWGGGATIGYKAAGSFYQNHALSGSSAASIGCVNSPASQWNNVVYQLNDGQGNY